MTDNMPATPLPWAVDTGPALKDRYHTVIANDGEVMICELYEQADEDAEKDAAYIVRACNSFPALLEALEGLVGEFPLPATTNEYELVQAGCDPIEARKLAAAYAVLAAAKGEA